jgi:hypothetical protein
VRPGFARVRDAAYSSSPLDFVLPPRDDVLADLPPLDELDDFEVVDRPPPEDLPLDVPDDFALDVLPPDDFDDDDFDDDEPPRADPPFDEDDEPPDDFLPVDLRAAMDDLL